ncbi:nuclear transport factor 2 family protein [Gordonia sp. PKS22-38]|uniref:Nuclear transport factor 2 family protein n=1 Tax=Gordonia prachuapensis TaxID=3115651 RepID=A0ABU7MUV5_9ACTN|nr:nuclear transport factor 2 family protein [Gordonia sp. PKS22-38]
MALQETYRRWIDDLWNGPSDADLLAEKARRIVTANFQGHWPGHDVHGPAELAAAIAETKEMFDSIEFSIEVGPFVDGEHVAGRWAGVGTRDGRTTRFIGNDILRAHGDRFAEYWLATFQL